MPEQDGGRFQNLVSEGSMDVSKEDWNKRRAMWFSGHPARQAVKTVWVVPGTKAGFGKIVGVVKQFEIGVHLHDNSQEAVDAANRERLKRIAMLQRQIDSLKELMRKDGNTEWV